jgi:hypothetical protein
MAPETEADQFSLLASLLTGVGNLMGRNAYVMAGNSRHYPNLFVALVGKSSKARKGTSWSVIRQPLGEIDSDWCQKRISGGLSTGEGLIWAIRDKIEKQEPIKKSGAATEYQTVVVDPGESDKRFMVVEGEFGQPLKAMQRDGNTLSAVIRNGWDSPPHLRALAKNSAAVASNPHISILTHITHEELKHLLSNSDAFNGFANRFLWGYVQRSKLLPEGGDMEGVELAGEMVAVHQAVSVARHGGRFKFDAAAQALWNAGYAVLSSEHDGLFGAVTSRSEAQVMRLALLYALFDAGDSIKEVHLRAALAFWKFCEESARFLFGSAGARTTASQILSALHERGEMARTSISRDLFNANLPADKLKAALSVLKDGGHADFRIEKTNGRSGEIWFAAALTKEAPHAA